MYIQKNSGVKVFQLEYYWNIFWNSIIRISKPHKINVDMNVSLLHLTFFDLMHDYTIAGTFYWTVCLALNRSSIKWNENPSIIIKNWERTTSIIFKLAVLEFPPTKRVWVYNCDKLSCLDQFTLLLLAKQKTLMHFIVPWTECDIAKINTRA